MPGVPISAIREEFEHVNADFDVASAIARRGTGLPHPGHDCWAFPRHWVRPPLYPPLYPPCILPPPPYILPPTSSLYPPLYSPPSSLYSPHPPSCIPPVSPL